MKEFDLEKEAKQYATSIYGLLDGLDDFETELAGRIRERCCAAYLAGANKALDLVMEIIEANAILELRIIAIDADELKAKISKLRGER